MLAIVERGSAGWRGKVEEIENKASLDIIGCNGRALVVSLGEKEYLSPRAALETSNSESDTSSKVSTCTSEGKVLVVESL